MGLGLNHNTSSENIIFSFYHFIFSFYDFDSCYFPDLPFLALHELLCQITPKMFLWISALHQGSQRTEIHSTKYKAKPAEKILALSDRLNLFTLIAALIKIRRTQVSLYISVQPQLNKKVFCLFICFYYYFQSLFISVLCHFLIYRNNKYFKLFITTVRPKL